MPDMPAKGVAIITNVLASYRRGFYRELIARYGTSFRVYCQDRFWRNLELVHTEFPDHVRVVRSIGPGNPVAWQRLPYIEIARFAEVVVITGDPRTLSNVVASILFRLLGKRVLILGQAHSQGASALTERIRHLWWRVAHYVAVYTDDEVDYLVTRGFSRSKVVGLNNGLDQELIGQSRDGVTAERIEALRAEHRIEDARVVISCARLIQRNRFDLMAAILPKVVDEERRFVWVVIGDGQERAKLGDLVVQSGCADHVRWLGPIYDEAALAPWFEMAEFMVHPGPIGLSLMHAFGYALPVVTHDNRDNHNPEIVALTSGETGLTFTEGSSTSLLEAVCELLGNPRRAASMGKHALRSVREKYNTRVMAERLAVAINSSVRT